MPPIRIENLHYRYPPFNPSKPEPEEGWVLEDVSLEIPAGEFLGIIGTTGGGKSTLCLALTGLVPQQTSGTIRGDVWIGETNTKRSPVTEIATSVGIVFQDPEANFLGLTVEDEVAFGPENLGVPRDELARRVAWALEMVGMVAFRERSVAQLSGGQKQRVAIAAVLAMTPEVLIMDDPTAELDPAGTAQVLELVRSVRERMPEMTVIMTSGDPEPLVAGADRIAVLRDGRLVAVDAPERLFADFADHFAAGVPAPPVYGLARELNRALNTSFTFHTTEAAAAGLGELLDARS